MKKIICSAICLSLILSLTACSCISIRPTGSDNTLPDPIEKISKAAENLESRISEELESISSVVANVITPIERRSLLKNFVSSTPSVADIASIASYSYDSSKDTIVNEDAIRLSDAEKELIEKNKFVVSEGYDKEFYSLYEMNRYLYRANFVTVDSMMHTYHLYFSYLLKNTERTYLSDLIADISNMMLAKSIAQYDTLKGTEWEDAALRCIAFFGVGTELSGTQVTVPSPADAVIHQEYDLIMAADGIYDSQLSGTMIDYSQFKPRGYYDGNELLERYFRVMMWYGQIGFLMNDEDLVRSAVLINLALEGEVFNKWEELYTITSFFAGASDDVTYYEFYPAICAAYGDDVSVDTLAGNEDTWDIFLDICKASLTPPAINSIPIYDDEDPETRSTELNMGYRFMGQRFTIDASIFQKLIYEEVQPDLDGNKRMLPDTLDVAAALGSERAEEILEEKGSFEYENYRENLDALKEGIETAADSMWSSSLYSSWLYTLKPLLEEKGEGYPEFMQSKEWQTKDLETFSGSYAELKHDTILYAKQVMAEMGGGDIPTHDDRGYVEPEVDVWTRFAALADMTCEGLASYGLISDSDVDNLTSLSQLAEKLKIISEKELREELLTDEEYDTIRFFGGELEHFWKAAYIDEGENISVKNYPAAIIADIATDPNGTCLEIGTGNPSVIDVLVYFDGGYHICEGAVYSFYQFEQPLSDRLTDIEWREMLGIAVTESGMYEKDPDIKPCDWTMDYKVLN